METCLECAALSGRQWAQTGPVTAVRGQPGAPALSPQPGRGTIRSCAAVCIIRVFLFCFIGGWEALMKRIGH